MANNFMRAPFGYGANWFMMDKKDYKRGGTAPHFESKPTGGQPGFTGSQNHQPYGSKIPAGLQPTSTHVDKNSNRVQVLKFDDSRKHDFEDDKYSGSNNTINLDELDDQEDIPELEVKPMHEDNYNINDVYAGHHHNVGSAQGHPSSNNGKKDIKAVTTQGFGALKLENEPGDSLLLDSFLNEDGRPSPTSQEKKGVFLKEPGRKDEAKNSANEMQSMQRPNSSYSMLRSNKNSKRVNMGNLYEEHNIQEPNRAATIQYESTIPPNDYDVATGKKTGFTRNKQEKMTYANPPATAGPIRASHGLRPPSRQKTPTKALMLEFPAGKAGGKVDNFMPVKSMFAGCEENMEALIKDIRDDLDNDDDFETIKIENKLNFSHFKDKKSAPPPKTVKIGSYLEGMSPGNTNIVSLAGGDASNKKVSAKAGEKYQSLPGTAVPDKRRFGAKSRQDDQGKRLSQDKIFHNVKNIPTGFAAEADDFNDNNFRRTGDFKRSVASAKGYGVRKDMMSGIPSSKHGTLVSPGQQKDHYNAFASTSANPKNLAMTDNYFKKNSNNSLPFNSSLEPDFLNLFAN